MHCYFVYEVIFFNEWIQFDIFGIVGNYISKKIQIFKGKWRKKNNFLRTILCTFLLNLTKSFITLVATFFVFFRVYSKSKKKLSLITYNFIIFCLLSDYYYAVMKWTPGNELFVQWLNRAQNETICMTYQPTSDEGKIVRYNYMYIFFENSQNPYWIVDLSNYMIFLDFLSR